MSEFFSPYDADRPLQLKCSCGRDHSASDHAIESNAEDAAKVLRARSMTAEFEAYSNEFIEASLVKALFPEDNVRRRFLRAVGKGIEHRAGGLLPLQGRQRVAVARVGLAHCVADLPPDAQVSG